MTEAARVECWERAHHSRARAPAASERNRRACRERQARLRALGLCIFDGHTPAAPPSPLCAAFRDRQRERAGARYRKTVADLEGREVRPYRRRA